MPAAVASLVVLTLTVIFWPVAALVRRRYRKPLPYTGREAKAYRWVRIGALLSLAAMGGWIGTILVMFSDLKMLSARFDWLVLLAARVRHDRRVRGPRARALAPVGRVEGEQALARQDLGGRARLRGGHLRLGRGRLPPGRHQHELLMQLSVTRELIPLSAPFTITGYTFTDMSAVVARISERGAAGEGEAAGVYYLGDDVDRMCAAIEHVRRDIEAGVDRESLRRLLPPGGARNALDCALWDLEAKRLGQPVWRIAGLERPRPLLTTFTIPANDPGAMADKGDRVCAGEIAEAEADRRVAARRRARARRAQGAPRRLDRRRRQPGLHRRRASRP